jgi:hypothetical protein
VVALLRLQYEKTNWKNIIMNTFEKIWEYTTIIEKDEKLSNNTKNLTIQNEAKDFKLIRNNLKSIHILKLIVR